MLVEQVLAKAKRIGEDVADQDPAVIIRTILRRYVAGEPLVGPHRSAPVSANVSISHQPNPASRSASTLAADGQPDPRKLLRERVLYFLAGSIQTDGLTKPIGSKNLAKQVHVSPNFIRTLIEELTEAGRLVEVEPRVGTRGPRYRVIDSTLAA